MPLRKRISLNKMSETSVWVTGESGSIYERFWNGLEWVFAPHDLPISAGHAVAVFIINQMILALSESGNLYQVTNIRSLNSISFRISTLLFGYMLNNTCMQLGNLACNLNQSLNMICILKVVGTAATIPLLFVLTDYVFFQQMHLQLGETSQPVWVEFSATLNQIKDNDQEKNSLILMKSGVVSDDGQ